MTRIRYKGLLLSPGGQPGHPCLDKFIVAFAGWEVKRFFGVRPHSGAYAGSTIKCLGASVRLTQPSSIT